MLRRRCNLAASPSSSAAPSSPAIRLMSLPTEIRLQIYRLLTPRNRSFCFAPGRCKYETPTAPLDKFADLFALRSTCTTIRDELDDEVFGRMSLVPYLNYSDEELRQIRFGRDPESYASFFRAWRTIDLTVSITGMTSDPALADCLDHMIEMFNTLKDSSCLKRFTLMFHFGDNPSLRWTAGTSDDLHPSSVVEDLLQESYAARRRTTREGVQGGEGPAQREIRYGLAVAFTIKRLLQERGPITTSE